MKRLKVTDKADADYITEELLVAYLDAVDVKGVRRRSVDENGNPVENKSYTDYGHELVFTKQFTYYSNGPAGPNYKCGSKGRFRWRNDEGDEFSPQAKCKGNDYWYKLYCPSC